MNAPRKIPVVEDNERHVKVMRDLLESHGYHVLGAHEGTQALESASTVQTKIAQLLKPIIHIEFECVCIIWDERCYSPPRG